MIKFTYVFLSLFMVFGLVACNNDDEPIKEPIKDVEVDPSAKNVYKDAMTQLYLNDNVAPLENVNVNIDGAKVTADEAMEILKDELKEHKYVGEYFNLVYYYEDFEQQANGTYLLDVKLEFSDGDNIYEQDHQATFTGEPNNFTLKKLEIKTG